MNSPFEFFDPFVWIVTSRNGDHMGGLIATHISPVSIVPEMPRVTVSLANPHFTRELVEASGAFVLHLLDESLIDWVWRFGLQHGREVDKLLGLDFTEGETGTPILNGVPGWMECRVETSLDIGDRTLYVADVVKSSPLQDQILLTLKRALALAPPAEKARLKALLAQDSERDAASILKWRKTNSLKY